MPVPQESSLVAAWLIVAALGVWSYVWAAIAMWKAARRDHLGWFIAVATLSFAGVLPMAYVFLVAPRCPEVGETPGLF
jgi:hypothetical protein